MSDPSNPDPLAKKLVDGLERLALALHVDRRRAAEQLGLNATQSAILRLLEARAPEGLRVGEIAEHIGVRPPTATDSVSALERKGLIARRPVTGDARASTIALAGALPPELAVTPFARAAISDLAEPERVQLLRLLTKLIRSLQLRGAIPPQRLCVSCGYFRPNVHHDASAPHHCALVDAPFGDGDLRLDCPEHQAASAAEQAANWTAFTRDRPQTGQP